MDLTKQEILRKHLGQSPSEFQDLGKKNILNAMEEYGEQEAKAFANWLLTQVVADRTIKKLWTDFRKEIS